MRVLLSSRSVRSLDASATSSASAIFEIGLCEGLARNGVEVVIVGRTAKVNERARGVTLVAAPSGGRWISALWQNSDRHSILVAIGYHTLPLVAMRLVGVLRGCTTVAYVFDHHSGAISKKKWLRRQLINLYFSVGFWLLRLHDGIVILNRRAASLVPSPKSNSLLLSRVGSVVHVSDRLSRPRPRPITCVYAGSLESYNCVGDMIEAMALLPHDRFRLQVYGRGSEEQAVRDASKTVPNVQWVGSLPRGKLSSKLLAADVLLCLRDTEDPIANFAFPSKLVEYLGLGRPVLATLVLSEKVMRPICTTVSEPGAAAIAEALMEIEDSWASVEVKSERAQDYVRTHHSWDSITAEVLQYFDSLRKH